MIFQKVVTDLISSDGSGECLKELAGCQVNSFVVTSDKFRLSIPDCQLQKRSYVWNLLIFSLRGILASENAVVRLNFVSKWFEGVFIEFLRHQSDKRLEVSYSSEYL